MQVRCLYIVSIPEIELFYLFSCTTNFNIREINRNSSILRTMRCINIRLVPLYAAEDLLHSNDISTLVLESVLLSELQREFKNENTLVMNLYWYVICFILDQERGKTTKSVFMHCVYTLETQTTACQSIR